MRAAISGPGAGSLAHFCLEADPNRHKDAAAASSLPQSIRRQACHRTGSGRVAAGGRFCCSRRRGWRICRSSGQHGSRERAARASSRGRSPRIERSPGDDAPDRGSKRRAGLRERPACCANVQTAKGPGQDEARSSGPLRPQPGALVCRCLLASTTRGLFTRPLVPSVRTPSASAPPQRQRGTAPSLRRASAAPEALRAGGAWPRGRRQRRGPRPELGGCSGQREAGSSAAPAAAALPESRTGAPSPSARRHRSDSTSPVRCEPHRAPEAPSTLPNGRSLGSATRAAESAACSTPAASTRRTRSTPPTTPTTSRAYPSGRAQPPGLPPSPVAHGSPFPRAARAASQVP